MKKMILAVSLLMASVSYGACVSFKNEERLVEMLEDSDDFLLYELSDTLNEAYIWLNSTMYMYSTGVLALDHNDFDYIKRMCYLIIMVENEYDKIAKQVALIN